MITKLYIENFRGIIKNEVELGKITVLTGPNNSGKSSIIYGLLALKNVVYAGGCMNLPLEMLTHERIEQFRSTCRAIKNIKEAHLIIKLHPYERKLNIYRKIVKETGLSNCSIVKNTEMLELFYNYDLLITLASTAAYEAVLLDKNVISLSGSSKFDPEDIWNFKKCDATIIVDNLEELEKYIRNALFNPETIFKLREGRKKYMYEHAYKLDGNASARLKEAIDSLSQNAVMNKKTNFSR